MKTMTCEQLGGACDTAFHADTFDEIAEQSRKHAMEMAEQGDDAHAAAMQAMRDRMQDPDAMDEWMDRKRNEFEALPEE